MIYLLKQCWYYVIKTDVIPPQNNNTQQNYTEIKNSYLDNT